MLTVTEVCLAQRHFPLTPDSPALARHFAVDAAGPLDVSYLADDLALVVAELAANAFRHARSGFTLTLSVTDKALLIAVRDEAPVPPGGLPTRTPHGLGVVAALASEWGVHGLGAGKVVWAELPLSG